jgi:hypothetical protein
MRVVPALDELEDRHARLSLGGEVAGPKRLADAMTWAEAGCKMTAIFRWAQMMEESWTRLS